MPTLPGDVSLDDTIEPAWGDLVRLFLASTGPGMFTAANQLLLAANAQGDTKVLAPGAVGTYLGVTAAGLAYSVVSGLPAGAANSNLLMFENDLAGWRGLNGAPLGLAADAGGFVYFQNSALRFMQKTAMGVGSQDGDHPQLVGGQLVWGAPALGFFSGPRAPDNSDHPDRPRLIAAPVSSTYLWETSPPQVWHKTSAPNNWTVSFIFPVGGGGGLDTSEVNQLIDNHDDAFGLTFDPATDRIQLRTDSGGTQNSLALRGFDMLFTATSIPAASAGQNGDWNIRQNGSTDEKVNGAWFRDSRRRPCAPTPPSSRGPVRTPGCGARPASSWPSTASSARSRSRPRPRTSANSTSTRWRHSSG